MSTQYTNQVLKVVVAQICQAIGWHSIQTTPLELMVDILQRYLDEISKQTYRYAELYNRTDANLDDIGLAYRDMNISLSDIEEYIQYVDPVPCAIDVPKYPIPKDSHLNFLKPGSKEVLTRPVYMHEYLPPIDPPSEDEEMPIEKREKTDGNVDVVNVNGDETPYFKRPGAISNIEKSDIKKPRVMFEEESRPIREISSVIMTTSGFISPAREGKLPDTKPPVIIQDVKPTPVHVPPPPITPVLPVNNIDGKFNDKKIKKIKEKVIQEKEKKKEKIPKDILKAAKKLEKMQNASLHNAGLLHPKQEVIPPPQLPNSIGAPPPLPNYIPPLPLPEKPKAVNMISPPKKLGRPRKDKSLNPTPPPMTPKKAAKLMAKMAQNNQNELYKQFLNPLNATSSLGAFGPLHKNPLMLNNLPPNLLSPHYPPANIPPNFPSIPPYPIIPHKPPPLAEEKISSEPDKQKLNIFKKISKVKDLDSISGKLDISKPEVKDIKPFNDQVIVIDDDQNSNPLPMVSSTPYKKEDTANDTFPKNNYPLNMSLPKTPTSSKQKMYNMQPNPLNFEINRGSQKAMFGNNPKPRKNNKPKKEKPEKLNKHNMSFFNNVMMNNDIYPFNNSNLFNEQMKQSRMPLQPSTSSGVQHNMQNFLQMFPFPSGPGLIPQMPFMNNFGQNLGMPRPPFPDLNLLLPRYRKSEFQEDNVKPSISIEKPHCNVAPLVPESLKLDIKPPVIPTISTEHSLPLPPTIPLHEESVSIKSHSIKLESRPIDVDEHIPVKLTSPPPVLHHHNQPTPLKETFIDLSKECEMDETDSIKDKKEDKKHKKEKKDKEGKIKKKKDKKEKLKNKEKEKAEKKKEREDKKELREKIKKEKREKKKEKERASLATTSTNDLEGISLTDSVDPSSVPKLMLKLGASPRPETPDSMRKITIKQIKKEEHFEDICASPKLLIKSEREPSPELARISPLVTRPPKPPKPTNMKKKEDEKHSPESISTQVQPAPIPNPTPTPGRGRPRGSTKVLNSPASKNLNNQAIKPNKSNIMGQIKSPKHQQTVTIGPVVTLGGPEKPPTTTATSVRDPEGNQVWICPACGRVDDGTPMIGCDGCDAWYHWVCVGIQVPPDVNEDWYCRVCIAKKQESHGSEKKKKRKKKDKKDH